MSQAADFGGTDKWMKPDGPPELRLVLRVPHCPDCARDRGEYTEQCRINISPGFTFDGWGYRMPGTCGPVARTAVVKQNGQDPRCDPRESGVSRERRERDENCGPDEESLPCILKKRIKRDEGQEREKEEQSV